MHKWVSAYDREEPMPVKIKLAKITKLFTKQLICDQLGMGPRPLGSTWVALGHNKPPDSTEIINKDLEKALRKHADVDRYSTIQSGYEADDKQIYHEVPVGAVFELDPIELDQIDLSGVEKDSIITVDLDKKTLYFKQASDSERSGDACRTAIEDKKKLLSKYLGEYCEEVSPGNCARFGPFKTYTAPVQGVADVHCQEPQQTALSCSSTQREPTSLPAKS